MYKPEKTVDAETLMTWLGKNDPVFVLDVRPVSRREEWQIPGSHYLDAYQRLKEGDESVLDEIEIPKDIKIVTVCAAGRISQIASQALQEKGFDAVSLEGGMRSWSKAWNIAEKRFSNCEILQVSALLQRIPDTPANYMAIVEKNLKGEFLEADAVELEAGANRCGVS